LERYYYRFANQTLWPLFHYFPLGVDYDSIIEDLSGDSMKRSVSRLKNMFAGKKLILSIDRMDYSKGIPQRLQGIELFLEQNPDWHEKC